MKTVLTIGGAIVLVVTAAILAPQIKVDFPEAAADDGRFTIVADDVPGAFGNSPIYKFTDGDVTCYFFNGDRKAGLSCLEETK